MTKKQARISIMLDLDDISFDDQWIMEYDNGYTQGLDVDLGVDQLCQMKMKIQNTV